MNSSTTDATPGLRYHSIPLPSGEITYIDESAGPPILLLHAAPLTALSFLRVIRKTPRKPTA